MVATMTSFALILAALLASSSAYKLEVYFVVDQLVVDRYVAEVGAANAQSRLETDADYFITELNQMFGTLSNNGLDIEIRKKGLNVLDRNLFPGNQRYASSALCAFDTWLYLDGHQSLNYDVAILWTGADIYETTTATAGYAHVGEACNIDSATAIVEYDLSYQTVVTTAHEIGHILGSGHDSTSTGYIMEATSSVNGPNRWTFSATTASSISTYASETSCMSDANTGGSTVPSQTIPSYMEDPDLLCQRYVNDSSYFLLKGHNLYGGQAPQGDEVCSSFSCGRTGSSSYYTGWSADGLICETSKRCNDGSCVSSSDATSDAVSNSCIWGDQPTTAITLNGNFYEDTCSNLVSQIGKFVCYFVDDECCATCSIYNTGIAGCTYGDTATGCSATNYICTNYASACCETCNGFTGKRSVSSGGNNGYPIPQTPSVSTPKKKKEEKDGGDDAVPNPGQTIS